MADSFNPKILSPSYLSKRYLEDFRANKVVTGFIDTVYKDSTYTITSHITYRTKAKAKVVIEGKYKDQYNKLWDYVEELKRQMREMPS